MSRRPVSAATKLDVALSFFVSDRNTSIWSNGATQNCVFLYLLYKLAPRIGNVWLVNGGDGARPHPGLLLDPLRLELHRPEDVLDRVDVYIEMGAQVHREHVERVHANGGRAITIKVGNDYVMDVERLVFGRQPGGIFNGTRFDAVWTLPHHETTCRSYFETCYRAPVRVVPYLWDPYFLERTIAELPPELAFGYRPGARPKRIGIFEPNMNVVKSSVFPMLVTEHAYRTAPELVAEVYVTNSVHLKEHLTFQHFCNTLDIVRNRVASFEARFNTPYFLARYADAVVSHQWENGLNNLYFDALHGRYPLVHNSPFLGDAGYRYDGFDAAGGGAALVRALREHDARLDAYREAADRVLGAARLDNPANLAAYTDPLFALFGA